MIKPNKKTPQTPFYTNILSMITLFVLLVISACGGGSTGTTVTGTVYETLAMELTSYSPETKTLNIKLTNTQDVTGFQFDIETDKGPVTISEGKAQSNSTSNLNLFTHNNKAIGLIDILTKSDISKNPLFSDHTGTLTITLTSIHDNATKLLIKNIIISDQHGNKLGSVGEKELLLTN